MNCKRRLVNETWEYYCDGDHDNLTGEIEACKTADELRKNVMEITESEANGVKNNFSFLQFFGRFIAVLYVMEIYNIFFFDWCLLCHSNFFPHFYSEVKHMFGYNKKQHFPIYILPALLLRGYAYFYNVLAALTYTPKNFIRI